MAPTLPEQLHRLAVEAPERECLRLLYPNRPDIVLNRAQFFRAAQKVAGMLSAAGVQPHDLVIMVQRDALPLTTSFFGAALLRAIPSIMPFQTEKLHPDRYRAAMAALIALSHPRVLLTEPDLYAEVCALLPQGGSGELPQVIAVHAEDLLQADHPLELNSPFDENDIALLQHSSGTTGLQKGVALAHRAIFEQLERYGQAIGFSPQDVVVSWLPLYHDMGLIAGFLMPLLGGARLVLMSPLDWVRAPHMLMRAISAHRGTLCWLPNFAYNFCAQKIREEDLDSVDLSSMRAFINCSEPVYIASHELFAQRFAPYGVRMDMLATCYAMAETVFAVTQSPIGVPAHVDRVDREALHRERHARPADSEGIPGVQRVLSSGRPIEGVEIRVLDEQRHPLPERYVGELAVRTSHMLSEYYRRPDATAEAFHEGWYLTGDMGYLADGEVYVLGRKKDLIIIGGRNIYPRDIEALVNTVEGIHAGRVAAFGIPSPERGTEDLAVVAEVDGELTDGRARIIAAAVRRVIAAGSDITVRYVELVPRGWLIKTSSGKVARAANREKFLAAHPEIRTL